MMAKEVLVNEPVEMLVRVLPSGSVVPTSFVWRDRTRYVADVGRQWEERVEGRSLRCYLVHTVDNNTFELRWDPAGDRWTVHRAWRRAAVV
jgi:hypothetical protein